MASINPLVPIGALAVGVAHAGLAPVVSAFGVHPNIALISVVFVAALLGPLSGAAWAFVVGLTVNVLGSDPLGVIPLVLVLVAVPVALAVPATIPAAAVYLTAGTAVASVVGDWLGLTLASFVAGEPRLGTTVDVLARSAALNGAVAGVVALGWAIWRYRRAGPPPQDRWPT